MTNKFSRTEILLIAVAILVAATIRLIGNNQPFPSSDHAQLASVVTFFYPRNVQMLIPSATSSWNMLTNPHGILPSFIAITTMTVVGLLGIHISEFWWNFPFIVINVSSLVLAAIIVARVYTPRAGVLAAFLIAILPLHASLSRASGVNIPLVLDCQFVTVLAFFHYFEEPTPRSAKWASIALAVNLTVEVLFPILLAMVFAIGLIAVKPSKPMLAMRIHRVQKLMFDKRVMLLPFAIIFCNFLMLVGYVNGWFSYGGVAARLMEGSDRKLGIYFTDFWNNATYSVGNIAFPLLLLLALAGLPALFRFEKRAIPLMWALVYLLPFLLFTRPHVFEYFLLSTVPLSLNAAIVFLEWWKQANWKRWIAATALPLLATIFALRMLSMVFNIDVVPALGTGRATGSIASDQGLKTAGWWVRDHSQPDEVVFADSTFEEYQIWYYVRRSFIGVTDAETPDEAYLLLESDPRQPSYYLVPHDHVDLLTAYADPQPYLAVTVVNNNTPLLYIYSDTPQEPEILDVSEGNSRFDEQFGTWRAMFAIGTRK